MTNVDLSVSAENITYLENETLTLTYNNTATGKINITLKSKNYNKKIEQDINQTITITSLPAGEYNVTVEYLGDQVFSNATAYTDFTVEKVTTEVIPDETIIDLYVDNETTITFTLKPEYALGNISFSSDDSSIVSVNSTSGDIIAKSEGTANITVMFSGNENYTSSNAAITINVKKIPTQITVNPDSLNLLVGNESSIAANLTPADAGNVTFTSNDKNIVTVDNQGNVIAVGEGNTTITVSFAGDYKYEAAENKTITVIVNLRDASVSVNNNTLDLNVDDTFNIVASTVPTGLNVTYTSNDTSVVTVDSDGKITAHAEGSAIITVSVGGDGIYALNSTNINVTVSKIPTNINITNDTVSKIPTNINITNNTVVLNVGDNISSGASLIPATAGNLTYTSSNATVAIVDGTGMIKGLKEGTAVITVSFNGNDQYAPAANKTINVTVKLRNASVSVNKDTLNLNVNDTFDIIATTVPRGLNVIYT